MTDPLTGRGGNYLPKVLAIAGALGVSQMQVTRDVSAAPPRTSDRVTVADDAEAREIARTLNEDRRAMPKEQRLEVVKALREDGHSTRAIAGAVGVSPMTVRRDISTGTGVPVPDRITGLDGKSRPARIDKSRAATAARRERVRELAAQGHTAKQVVDVIRTSEAATRGSYA